MNICADCQNPVNSCSWEREFKPVEGWTADETTVFVQGKRTKSYNVIECPLFTPPPGYVKKKHGARKVTAKNIFTGETITFRSVTKAAQYFGVSDATVIQYIRSGMDFYDCIVQYTEGSDPA